MKYVTICTFMVLCTLFLLAGCGDSYYDDVFTTENFRNIVSVREEARLTEQMLQEKVENFLPVLMRQEGVDMWLITRDDRSLYPFLIPAD